MIKRISDKKLNMYFRRQNIEFPISYITSWFDYKFSNSGNGSIIFVFSCYFLIIFLFKV